MQIIFNCVKRKVSEVVAHSLKLIMTETLLSAGSIQTSYLITFTSFQEFPQKPSEVHGALNNLEIGMLQDDNILLISDENGKTVIFIIKTDLECLPWIEEWFEDGTFEYCTDFLQFWPNSSLLVQWKITLHSISMLIFK